MWVSIAAALEAYPGLLQLRLHALVQKIGDGLVRGVRLLLVSDERRAVVVLRAVSPHRGEAGCQM